MRFEEFLHEAIPFYRQPDHADFEAGRSWQKLAEAGSSVPDLCHEHGMSSAMFDKWRALSGGMDVLMMSRLKELEDENRRLKKMYADVQLPADVLKEAMSKKW
jgi:putative transposase